MQVSSSFYVVTLSAVEHSSMEQSRFPWSSLRSRWFLKQRAGMLVRHPAVKSLLGDLSADPLHPRKSWVCCHVSNTQALERQRQADIWSSLAHWSSQLVSCVFSERSVSNHKVRRLEGWL